MEGRINESYSKGKEELERQEESGMKTNGEYFREERVTCDRKVIINKK